MSEKDTAAEEIRSEEELKEEIREDSEWVDKAEKKYRKFQMFMLRLVAFFLALWVLFGLIVGLATVPNTDMEPSLHAGDLMLYYRLDKDVSSQDIIIFEKNDTRYVGRVIAVAGETVEITDQESVKVNGNTLIEHNIYRKTPRLEGFTEYPLQLKKGECFVLVDGRTGEDSRYFGPVKISEIRGTVITIWRRNNL